MSGAHGPATFACLAFAAVLAGCSGHAGADRIVERVQSGPLRIEVQAQGDIHATNATPLAVPGQQFTSRQLAWILPAGSRVGKGELIARFSAQQSKQDLAAALIDLERNTLARVGKRAELATQHDKLDVDMSQVDTQLFIAQRYAHANLLALSRDKILDSVQDEHFLTTKKGILAWELQQSGTRGAAELAVIDAKRATFELDAKQKRADLDALEVRAPHDGILMLQADWSGVVPHVGSNMWAGNNFATLPDTASLEVQLWVPEQEAQGITVGDVVELHPLGEPGQTTTTKLSWISPAAQPRSQQSLVRYISVKAPVPAAAVRRYGWLPGQRMAARVVLLDASDALSVPNLAIGSDGASVELLAHGKPVAHAVTLGVRGASRSQILAGLKAGDEVVLGVGAKAGAP